MNGEKGLSETTARWRAVARKQLGRRRIAHRTQKRSSYISPLLPRVCTYTRVKVAPLPESVGSMATTCCLSPVPTFSLVTGPESSSHCNSLSLESLCSCTSRLSPCFCAWHSTTLPYFLSLSR